MCLGRGCQEERVTALYCARHQAQADRYTEGETVLSNREVEALLQENGPNARQHIMARGLSAKLEAAARANHVGLVRALEAQINEVMQAGRR